jgi:hypothetical protein
VPSQICHLCFLTLSCNVVTRIWENNIKTYLKETGYEDVDWIQLAHNRILWWALEHTVMNLRVP